MSAVAASATAEQFPSEGRLSGLAFGVTSATALFGGVAPYVSQLLLERTGWAPLPGALIALVAVFVLPVLWRMPETAWSVLRYGLGLLVATVGWFEVRTARSFVVTGCAIFVVTLYAGWWSTFAYLAALAPVVASAVRPGDAVLVKGSLGSRMRLVVEALEGRQPGDQG